MGTGDPGHKQSDDAETDTAGDLRFEWDGLRRVDGSRRGQRRHLYATLPSGSSTWSTNTKVSDDPGTAFQGIADIAVDGVGNVLVSWTDQRASPYQLRVRRLPAGGSWTPSTVVAADGGNSPSIAVRSDGRAYLAWHDGNFSTLYPRLWGASYDQATGIWSSPERIDTNGSDHGAATPATAIDTNRIMVIWKNALSVPSGQDNDDIFSRVRTP
jgi:hypothetical protein